jgi:YD repeat-containing protein
MAQTCNGAGQIKEYSYNGKGRLTATLAKDGYEFSVKEDDIRKMKADCIKGLRRRSIGGYVEILRLDYTDNK